MQLQQTAGDLQARTDALCLENETLLADANRMRAALQWAEGEILQMIRHKTVFEEQLLNNIQIVFDIAAIVKRSR
jgi:hypothetical protein